jgi:citrate synthase
MKIGSQAHRSSSISASNPETVIVRGHDLTSELIGRVSLTEHFWLLLTGTLPSLAQRQVLDATLVAIAEHGLVPSVVASRMTLAAAPDALQGAVAAGLLGCGSVVLGSAEAAGQLFAQIAAPTLHGKLEPEALQAAIAAAIQQLRSEGRPIPGYGHPLHKTQDPRARRLMTIAREAGVAGRHIDIAERIERMMPSLIGRALSINVSGAIAAVLLDADYPLMALKGVPILARAAGLIAHLLEEQQRPIGFVLAHAAAAAIDYDGPAPAGFEAGDE